MNLSSALDSYGPIVVYAIVLLRMHFIMTFLTLTDAGGNCQLMNGVRVCSSINWNKIKLQPNLNMKSFPPKTRPLLSILLIGHAAGSKQLVGR